MTDLAEVDEEKDREMSDEVSAPAAAPAAASAPPTLPGQLARWAADRGRSIAIRHKLHGRWVAWTWGELEAEVARVAGALGARGFGPGDVVAIGAGLSPEGLVVTLAAQGLGGAAIWVDREDAHGGAGFGEPSGPGAAGAGTVSAAGPAARFGFARDETTLARLEARFGFLGPWVLGLIAAEHAPPQEHPVSAVRAYADVAASAAGAPRAAPLRARPSDTAFFFAGGAASRADSCAGPPPGAPAITHAAVVEAARAWLSVAGLGADDRAFTSEAPTTEAAAIFVAGWLVGGISLELPEDTSTADADRREVQPTIVAATGAAYGRLERQVAENLPLPGTFVRAIVDAGLEATTPGRAPRSPQVLRTLGNWLVCRPLREVLGLRRVKAAVVLGPATPPPSAVQLLARLGLHLRALPVGSGVDAATPASPGSRRVADRARLCESPLARSAPSYQPGSLEVFPDPPATTPLGGADLRLRAGKT